jgi:PAS domain S-box-containing protein
MNANASPPVSRHDAWALSLRIAGCLGLLIALSLLWARFAASGWALDLAARLWSPDGIVTAAGRRSLEKILLGGAIGAATLGTFFLALANRRWRGVLEAAIRWDPLRERGLATPNAYCMLAISSSLGLLLVAFWTLHGRLGAPVAFLLAKEGPFETATFVFEFVAALLCATAAWRLRQSAVLPRAAPVLFGLCALGLLVIGMEEINWGQTLLGFSTPASWSAINYQNETSVHNLLDRDTLTVASKGFAIIFAAAALLLISWSVAAPRSLMGVIAPHASLAPLALMVGYGGVYLHAEAVELLLAVFFVCYSSRIYVAAARAAVAAPRTLAAQHVHANAEPALPLSTTRSSWDTELLEYTHDAIIIWQMNGQGILYWNAAAERLYGYSRDEARGRITHELLKTRLAGGVSYLEKMVARYGIWIGELQHTTRDGRRVQVEARLALMSQQDGRWLVLEVNRDVTDRKVAEAERAAIQRKLAEIHGLHDRS